MLHSTTSRGGMLSALFAIAIVFMLRPKVRWDRPLALGLIAGIVLLGSGFSIQLEGRQGYEISADQLILNITSTFGEGHGKWEATKNWRMDWWKQITDYTFNGQYFWSGKGYGVNLAWDDGIVDPDAQSGAHA